MKLRQRWPLSAAETGPTAVNQNFVDIHIKQTPARGFSDRLQIPISGKVFLCAPILCFITKLGNSSA